jgi:AraC-like DNA-binding protein
MERCVRLNMAPARELARVVRSVQYMDTPTQPEGFVVGAWPRSMLVIPVPTQYRFETPCANQYRMYRVTIIGPHTVPIVSFNEGARNRGISVEFTDLGAYQLLGVPQHELTDRMVNADVFFPAEMLQELIDAVHASEDPLVINDGVQNALVRFVRGAHLYPVHPTVARVLAATRSAPWQRIERIATDNATTPRTLRRLFQRHIGVQPKRYFSICRVHAVMEAILAGQHSDLASIANEYGFHDHAHLDRAFRRDLLISPTALKRSLRHQELNTIVETPDNYREGRTTR